MQLLIHLLITNSEICLMTVLEKHSIRPQFLYNNTMKGKNKRQLKMVNLLITGHNCVTHPYRFQSSS